MNAAGEEIFGSGSVSGFVRGFKNGRPNNKVRHYLIFRLIERLVQNCSGESWQDVAPKLARIAHWEFEDYREFEG
jgi:hypothetical protein